MDRTRIGLMVAAIALTVGLLQGGSCMIGVLGDGRSLWLHDGVTLGGEAQVLEARTAAVYKLGKLVEATKSEILQSAVGTGVAKALIGGGARIIAARERKATRVTNSAAAKGGKAKGGTAEGGKGGDANAEGGTGYGGDANAEANAEAEAEASARAKAEAAAEAEATGIEINFPDDDPCLTGDCD